MSLHIPTGHPAVPLPIPTRLPTRPGQTGAIRLHGKANTPITISLATAINITAPHFLLQLNLIEDLLHHIVPGPTALHHPLMARLPGLPLLLTIPTAPTAALLLIDRHINLLPGPTIPPPPLTGHHQQQDLTAGLHLLIDPAAVLPGVRLLM